MEGICPICNEEEYLVGITCNKCSTKIQICSNCIPKYVCTQCIIEKKLKSEAELYIYMFFQPKEDVGILDITIKNEVVLISKNSPKTSGFSYPSLSSQIPVDKIPYYYSASCQLGPKHYIITGGLVVESETYFYSLTSSFIIEGDIEYWELYPIPALKQGRHCHKLFILGERLYVLGGINKDVDSPELKFLSECEYLNIPKLEAKIIEQDYPLVSDNTGWTSTAPMNVKRAQFNGFVFGDFIYVFGGYSGSQVQENSIERYHPSSNKWELLKDVKLGDKLSNDSNLFLAESLCLKGSKADEFIILGGTNGKTRFDTVYAYYPKEHKINELCRLKQARSGAHGFADENTLYILGGDSELLTFEKVVLQEGKATVEQILPDFEDQIESVNFEGIQGLFFGIQKTPDLDSEKEVKQTQK